MGESAHDRRKREDAEWEHQQTANRAAKAEREIQRKAQALSAAQNDAMNDRDRYAEQISDLEATVSELRNQLFEEQTTVTKLQSENVLALGRVGKLRDGIERGLRNLNRGEHHGLHDVLRMVLARDMEDSPPIELGSETSAMIPVSGRGLKQGQVSFQPTSDGLVVRVEDTGNAEFWLQIVCPESRLLTLLAQVHRLRHSRATTPKPDDTVKG